MKPFVPVFAILLAVSPAALAKKTPPKTVENQKPDAPVTTPKPDKAQLCYALGRTYGYAYWALNDTWRAKSEIFERFCTLHPAQGPLPTESEVAQLLTDLTQFTRTLDD